jgi:hypothetical protein
MALDRPDQDRRTRRHPQREGSLAGLVGERGVLIISAGQLFPCEQPVVTGI